MKKDEIIYNCKQWMRVHYDSQIFWIRTGVIGIWCIVVLMLVQAFHSEDGASPVYVTGGSVDANVSGSVDVENTVDVNLDEVLGRPVGCRTSYTINGREYQSIDVSNRGW